MADLGEELAEVRDAGGGGGEATIEFVAIHLPVVLFRHESAEHVELPVRGREKRVEREREK